MMKVLVSACLLGEACRYDGKSKSQELPRGMEYYPICPEVEGGLSIPRDPAEKAGDVVMTKKGMDVTEAFVRGAQAALELAQKEGIKYALLKENSPSCGVHCIYDGSFSGRLLPGAGVTTDLLRQAGVKVFNEKEGAELERESREADKKG